MVNILIWLMFIPLAFSLVIFLVRATGWRTRRLPEVLQLTGITLIFALAVGVAFLTFTRGSLSALGEWFYADQLTAVFLLVIGVMGFLNGLYAIGYLRYDLEKGETKVENLSTFYGFFQLFLFTMFFTVLSNNIALMWVGIEATTLGSVFLVGFYGKKTSLEAAWKYILICSVGIAFALYGTILIYSGSFNHLHNAHNSMLWTEVFQAAGALDPQMVKLAFVFILIGFGTKAGLFPMHTWLPDAHSEAPSPVSSLLSGVLLNCAMFAIIRYYMIAAKCLGTSFPRMLLLVFGVLSIACAAFLIFGQKDIKRMFAYSSIENMGIIATGLGIGGPLGVFAALFHTINHSVTKSLLFCTSGNILIKYGTRDIGKIKGLFKIAPVSAVLLGAGALGIAGCPPLNIFISKLLTISAGIEAGYLWLMILCLALLVVVFAAFLRLIGKTLFGEPPAGMTKGDLNWPTLFPLVVLFILMLGLGIHMPEPLYQLLQEAADLVSKI